MFTTKNPIRQTKVLILYRNFKKGGASHVGLGVGASHKAKVLKELGVDVAIDDVWEFKDVVRLLEGKYKDRTHVIIEALWIGGKEMAHLCYHFSKMHFVETCHSQINFLQVEAGAIKILRELFVLQDTVSNFNVAGNSKRFCDLMEEIFNTQVLYLPNLYDIPDVVVKPKCHDKDVIKCSSFGAVRLMKLKLGDAAAALALGRLTGKNIEFYINTNRQENNGAGGIIQAMRNMFDGLPWAKIIEVPWADFAQFKHIAGSMDIAFQMSCSETHNLSVSDAMSQGVPAIVGPAIEWANKMFQVDIDDSLAAAKQAKKLLENPYSGQVARQDVIDYVKKSKKIWIDWLNGNPKKQKNFWNWF